MATENNIKSSWKPILLVSLIIVYACSCIFRWGGDEFVQRMNNGLTIILALLITLTVMLLWHLVASKGENRLLWLGMMIGWIFWTIAETWWGVSSYVNKELPYPSFADVLWLVGYIPMYIALIERLRSLPKATNPAQKVGFWLLTVVFTGLTAFFLVKPAIEFFDPTNALASILYILYPLTDLTLVILVLLIFFNYQKGTHGITWIWLTAGFFLLALSDMVFAYADWNGMYYPDGQANLLSTMGVDFIYNISYLFILIGMITTLTLRRTHHTFSDLHTVLSPIPNTHVLIFLNHDGLVDDASANCKRVFLTETVRGKALVDLLGISPRFVEDMMNEFRRNKPFEENSIVTTTRFGQTTTLISGLSIMDPQGVCEGGIVLLRMFVNDFSLDKSFTDYEKGIILNLVKKVNVKEEEDTKHFLTSYYLPYFKSFYNLLLEEGGSLMTDAYLAELRSTARQNGWEVDFNPTSLLGTENLALIKAQKALPGLFETAKEIAVKVTDGETVNKILSTLGSRQEKIIEDSVKYFESPDLIILHHQAVQ